MPKCKHCSSENIERASPTNEIAKLLVDDKELYKCLDCNRWTTVTALKKVRR